MSKAAFTPNGEAIFQLIQMFSEKNHGIKLTIKSDEENDYEIFFPPIKETANESEIFDLCVTLADANRSGFVKFKSAGYFHMNGKQSILLYESRDHISDEAKIDYVRTTAKL